MKKYKIWLSLGVVITLFVLVSVLYRYIDGYDTNRLFKAIEKEDVSAVEDLLKEGVDPNRPDHMPIPIVDEIAEISPTTPLSRACEIGNYDIVCALVEYGADCNYIEGMGEPPLVTALRTGYTDDTYNIVKFLLDRGAEPDPYEYYNTSCIDYAVRMYPGVYDESLQQYVYDKTAAQSVTEIVKMILKVDDTDIEKEGTLLIVNASLCDNIPLVEYLISIDCDPWEETDGGISAMYWATKNGNEKMIELINSCKTD